MGDLLHQGFILTPVSPRDNPGSGVEGFADAVTARGNIGVDEGCLELCEIDGGACYRDRPVPIKDAMAIGDAGGADAGELQGNYLFIQQTK
jgi:hypothetical protein